MGIGVFFNVIEIRVSFGIVVYVLGFGALAFVGALFAAMVSPSANPPSPAEPPASKAAKPARTPSGHSAAKPKATAGKTSNNYRVYGVIFGVWCIGLAGVFVFTPFAADYGIFAVIPFAVIGLAVAEYFSRR